MNENEKIIVLGGGCFWCIESVFDMTKGVISAESGYAGGQTQNPTYEEVCSGKTGHAEVVKLTYNSEIINLQEILTIFFSVHDPTQKNRQGVDVGTQYRSAIYYTDIADKAIIESEISRLNNSNHFKKNVTTEIKPLDRFYKAENYHQNYYQNNEFAPYCSYTIKPKVRKFKTQFPNLIRRN